MSEMIGRLRVALGLETAAFEKGAKRASAEIDAFGSRAEKAGFKIGSMAKTIAAGGAALAGSALAQQLKSVVEEGLRYAQTVNRMAQVSNASVEEFQKAAYAANTVGIETEKLADIYKDMNDRVGDFLETGGGPMADFFENIAPKVGITAEAFRNLSGPQALQLYVSSLEKAGVNQQQMTFYMEAIASDSTALIPILKNNGEAFRLMGEEARKAGIILTQDQISKADVTAKKIEALKNALNVKVSAVVIENADAIGQIANSLAKLLEVMLKLVAAGARFANSPAGKLLGSVNTAAGYLNPVKAAAALNDLVESERDRQRRPVSGAGGVGPARAAPSGWGKTTGAPLLQGGSVYRGPTTNFVGGGGLIGNGAISEIAGQAPGRGESLAERAWQQADRLAAVQGVLVEEAADTARQVEVSNVQIARSFGEMAQDSIDALDRLSNAVRGGGALDVLGAIIGLGIQLGSIGAFGKGVAANINKPRIPAYAGGTAFHPGGLALVGERGPEIVRLPRGSSVYPHGTGPHGGGAGGLAVQVLPSRYFDVRVMENVGAAAPMIASAGADMANSRLARTGRRRIG